jgi:hypothetical protein
MKRVLIYETETIMNMAGVVEVIDIVRKWNGG